MSTQFEKRRQVLENQLSQNAFRFGTSAFRLGLVPQGISDHLPIAIDIAPLQARMVSWNLLADVHLYNNFMNISGTLHLEAAIKAKTPGGNIYCNDRGNRLYHLFSELAEFLYAKGKQGHITINEKTLNEFIPLDAQSSHLARSEDPQKLIQEQQELVNARKDIVEILLDQKHEHAHEFKLAIRHSLELIHHIQSEEGALKWSNRLQRIIDNENLLSELLQADIVCLQECTSPDDVYQLYIDSDKSMKLIQYRVNSETNDHCVLMYDENKFDLIGEPIFHSLEGKKPCIFAKLQNKSSGQVCIVSSIHHPGGDKYLLDELLAQVARLKQDPNEAIPFCVAGDYNHTKEYFENHERFNDKLTMHYPEQGTMAGSDFGNTNLGIDAIMTNIAKDNISVKLVDNLAVSPPAQTPISVHFELEGKTLAYANPRFFRQVQRTSDVKMAKNIIEDAFGLSKPTLGPITVF